MQRLGRLFPFLLIVVQSLTLVIPIAAQSIKSQQSSGSSAASWWDDPTNWIQQFVPADREFWESSKFWTTNYGPAFRDVAEQGSQFLGCTSQFALCFHSGAEPSPCTLSPDGRSANCLCSVATKTNYTLITAILNYPVYQKTVQQCKADGSSCPNTGQAPVCGYLPGGRLIPGADVISTYDPDTLAIIKKIITGNSTPPLTCPKGPYAGCMTAPCTLNPDGTANCKCPVFYGRFMLTGDKAVCSLGGNLVPSASYIPAIDPNPYQ